MGAVVRWVEAGAGDRRRAADALVRRVVAVAHGVAAADVRVGRRCPRCGSTAHGAPWAALPDRRRVAVSITRTDAVLAAAAADRPVGIDLEPAGQALAPGFADVVLGDAERPALEPVDRAVLLRAWVHKEAVLKAAGTGLDVDPHLVRLVRGRDGAFAVADGPAGTWTLGDLLGVPGHVGAIALAGDGPGPAIDVTHA